MERTTGFVDIISLLETVLLGTLGALFAVTNYHPLPKPPEVQSASTIADISAEVPTAEFVMGPLVDATEPTPNPQENQTSGEVTEQSATVLPTKPLIPTPTSTAKPTKTPTNTPTKTPTPTTKPTPPPSLVPTRIPSPTHMHSPTPTLSPTIPAYVSTATASGTPTSMSSLSADIIFQRINEHRKKLNKIPFQKHEYLCSLAQDRSPELYNEIFGTAYVHEGFYKRNLPYWITENMAHYATEEKIMSWWLQSSLHRRSIEGNYTYSCGACSGNSCVQLFTNFVPRIP